jgi:hypothetical protein
VSIILPTIGALAAGTRYYVERHEKQLVGQHITENNVTSPEEALIENFRRWSQILLWVSIILPIIGALAVGTRYYVERHEKQLTGQVATRNIEVAKQYAKAAQQDAKEAHQAASTARNDLAEFKRRSAPRRLSMSQKRAIVKTLTSVKKCPVAVACRMMDGESCDFCRDLIKVFRESGWPVPDPIVTSVNDITGRVVVMQRGNVSMEDTTNVEKALLAAGIPVSIDTVKENSIGLWYRDAVHIIVGRKATE